MPGTLYGKGKGFGSLVPLGSVKEMGVKLPQAAPTAAPTNVPLVRPLPPPKPTCTPIIKSICPPLTLETTQGLVAVLDQMIVDKPKTTLAVPTLI